VQAIKGVFKSLDVLVHFNPKKPIVLQSDASLYALGAVLSQIQPNGSERPVCFSSKTVDRAQQQYTTTERECLAVVWATETNRTLLLGNPFTLEVDHTALKHLLAHKASIGKLAQWSLKLQEFDMVVTFRYSPEISSRSQRETNLEQEGSPEAPRKELTRFILPKTGPPNLKRSRRVPR
jgi:hypothetical protein